MKTHIVLYRDSLKYYERPFAFICEADDVNHAEEQLENAYPDADIVWVHEGTYIEDAYAEYWSL